MTEKLKQSLSAVIDDEADQFELRRVLDELDRDPAMRALWDRYHIIGSALRGERGAGVSMLPADMGERVWQALGQGDNVPAAHAFAPAAGGRLGRFTGLAVAATVAFAVVLGFNGFIGGGQEPAPGVAAIEAGTEPAAGPGELAGEARDPRTDLAAEASPSDVQRAHAYMLHHAQQQALNQAGVMSFVKMATYEAP